MAQRAGVTFELERLEFDGDQLVVSGHWSGVRGLRFVRPTLVASDRRILATLEHKPWAPSVDRAWTAAFPWKGGDPDVAGLALAVAPQVTVPLAGEPLRLPEPDAAPATVAAPSGSEPVKAAKPRKRATARTKAAPAAAAKEEKPSAQPVAAATPGKETPPAQPVAAAAPGKEKPPAQPVATATAKKGKSRAQRAAAAPGKQEPPPAAGPPPDAVAALEAQLAAVVAERDALLRRLEDAERLVGEHERCAAGDATVAHDELIRARATAERERDRALAQLAEAVEAREAAVRTRARMQLAHEEAIAAREVADDALATAHAERDEANAQRDEVLLAYRALQRHVQTERAHEDRRGEDPEPGDPEEPMGVRTMPAARTVMAELQRPPPVQKVPVSKFDMWVIRVLGSVAAGCFILLLISILRVFI